MRKRTGLRKTENTGPGIIPRKPSFMSQRQWDDIPISQRKKVLENIKRTEGKSATMGNPADFVKGIIAAEGGFPMDIASFLAPGGGMSQAQRLTQMRPGGYPGYKEQEFVPEFKGTTPDLYSKMGGDPTSGAGLFGEFMAPGAIIMAPIAAVRAGIKGARSLLSRVFGAGQNIFTSNPANATLELVENIEKQVAKGKKNIARVDKDTGEIVVNIDYLKSPKRQKDYVDKQTMEYAGFWDYLEQQKKDGRTTISLSELEDFWAQNNLDIRETHIDRYDSQYRLEGGTNQRSVAITYHGKQPPMSEETLQNLNNIAQHIHKKDFVDLDPNSQREIEIDYKTWYPGDNQPANIISRPFTDSNTELHHNKENVLFHLRMDDRVGVGEQSGEKILNVFEIQSDWYQRVNREGMYDLEKYDIDISKLEHKNRLIDEQLRAGNIRSSGGFLPVAEVANLRAQKNTNKLKMDEFREQRDIISGELAAESAAPKGPFMTPGKGEHWVELAVKRILKMAVDGNYDRVTFGTREIQGKIYPGLIQPVSKFKIKKMKRSAEFDIAKKQFKKDGTVLNQTTPVKGTDYPYYVEAYDNRGNLIRQDIQHYNEETLVNMFGENLTNRIKEKARTNRLASLYPGTGEELDIGMQNLNVLYEYTLPSVLKKGHFKKYNLNPEKVHMGMAITPSEIRAADQQFNIDEEFLGRNNIELNDNWEQPEFFYNDVDGNRVSVDIEGLENALQTGGLNVTAPPGGLDIPAITTAARNIHNRLTIGTQGNLQNLPQPEPVIRPPTPDHNEQGISATGMYRNVQELVNPGGFESRLDRYQHPMHRNRAGADARSLLEDSGITFHEDDVGVTFNVAEDSPLAYARQDIYTSSWEYLQAYRRAGGHPTAIPEEVKLMREIEIANAIESGITGMDTPPIVDRQYINLMNPETRAIELSHIEAELQTYGIRIYPGPTPADRPRFGAFEEGYYDDAVSADELDFGQDYRLYNLARRYEIAGSHRVDPNEVLDVTRAEVMPYHIEQDLDGSWPFTSDDWLAENVSVSVPDPPALLTHTEVGDQIVDSFYNNPSVTNARNGLEEMGIQTFVHRDGPPYISFEMLDNEPPHGGPTSIWRGINEFTEALDNGIVQPAVNTDELENAARHYAGVIHDRIGPAGAPDAPALTPDDVQYTGLQTGQQALPAPAQSQVAIADINWQDVASNDIHSDSHRIFEAISPGAQEDLINMREMADTLNTEEFGNIGVDFSSLNAPRFLIGDHVIDAREFPGMWHDLGSIEIETLNDTVEALIDTHARFVRRIQETEGTHLDLEVITHQPTPAAGLLEDAPQPEFTERTVRDQPMQWSVKLNDKIKKAYKESPPPYALIPPGILAGEAARQQGQQQSILDENIW